MDSSQAANLRLRKDLKVPREQREFNVAVVNDWNAETTGKHLFSSLGRFPHPVCVVTGETSKSAVGVIKRSMREALNLRHVTVAKAMGRHIHAVLLKSSWIAANSCVIFAWTFFPKAACEASAFFWHFLPPPPPLLLTLFFHVFFFFKLSSCCYPGVVRGSCPQELDRPCSKSVTSLLDFQWQRFLSIIPAKYVQKAKKSFQACEQPCMAARTKGSHFQKENGFACFWHLEGVPHSHGPQGDAEESDPSIIWSQLLFILLRLKTAMQCNAEASDLRKLHERAPSGHDHRGTFCHQSTNT